MAGKTWIADEQANEKPEDETLPLDLVRSCVQLQLEAWRLDPDPLSESYTLKLIGFFIVHLLQKSDQPYDQNWHEVNVLVQSCETLFSQQNVHIKQFKATLLRATIIRNISQGEAQPLNRDTTFAIVAMLEQYSRLVDNLDNDDKHWLSACFRELFQALVPESDDPRSLQKLDDARALVQRALTIVPNDLVMIAAKASVLRLRGSVLFQRSGVTSGKNVPRETVKEIARLFQESWALDHSDAAIANILGQMFTDLKEYAIAEFYLNAAVTLKPSFTEARERLNFLQHRSELETALQSFSQAVLLFEQRRYQEALRNFEHAEAIFKRIIAVVPWQTLRENLYTTQKNIALLHEHNIW